VNDTGYQADRVRAASLVAKFARPLFDESESYLLPVSNVFRLFP
jgi:hypothetical protein